VKSRGERKEGRKGEWNEWANGRRRQGRKEKGRRVGNGMGKTEGYREEREGQGGDKREEARGQEALLSLRDSATRRDS